MNLSKPASSEEEKEKKGGEKVLNIYNAQSTTNFTSEQNKFVHLRSSFTGNHRHHAFCWKMEKKMLWDQNTRWNLQHYCCHPKTRIHVQTSHTTVVIQRPEYTFKPLTLLLSPKDQNTRWNLQHYCWHPKTRIHVQTSHTTVVTQRPEYTLKPPTLLLSAKHQDACSNLLFEVHFPKKCVSVCVCACVRACTHYTIVL